jgi:hypothetical protein
MGRRRGRGPNARLNRRGGHGSHERRVGMAAPHEGGPETSRSAVAGNGGDVVVVEGLEDARRRRTAAPGGTPRSPDGEAGLPPRWTHHEDASGAAWCEGRCASRLRWCGQTCCRRATWCVSRGPRRPLVPPDGRAPTAGTPGEPPRRTEKPSDTRNTRLRVRASTRSRSPDGCTAESPSARSRRATPSRVRRASVPEQNASRDERPDRSGLHGAPPISVLHERAAPARSR